MKSMSLFFRITTLLLVIALVISCKKTDNINPGDNPGTPVNNYTPPAVTFSATVQGFVVDDAGNAVDGAEVKTGSKTAKTNVHGHFKIEAAPFTGDFCYIKAVKKGFFTGSTTVHGKAGNEFAAELVMVPQNNVVSFPATQGKTITLTGGAEVKLPANGFVTSTGSAYTGNVNVAVKHIDPAAKNFSSLIPGGDLRAFDANRQNTQLYSYGMLNVEMRDDAGNLLQLASGKKSTLTIPVPAAMTATAPATIPLWYFDGNKGVWIEEGKATLQGNKYVGTVSHFTPWCCCKPHMPSMIKGKVVDKGGNPMPFTSVLIGQIRAKTDYNGNFNVIVWPDSEITIDVVNDLTGEPFGLAVKAKTLGQGQTLDAGNITVTDIAKITATVKNCDGSAFDGYVQIATRRIVVSNSKVSFGVLASGDQAILTFYKADFSAFHKETITLPTDNGQTKDIGEIKVCSNFNDINYIKFTFTEPGKEPIVFEKIDPEWSMFFHSKSQPNDLGNIHFANGYFGASQLGYRITFAIGGIKTEYALKQFGEPDIEGYMAFQISESGYTIASKDVILKLSKYGVPGDVVTGTFTGKAKKNGVVEGTITGEFKVLRVSDR